MTDAEIKALTDAHLEKAIADIGSHPFGERFQEELATRKAKRLRRATA